MFFDQYWFLSESDYTVMEAALAGSGYTLDSFHFMHVDSGPFKGWYAAPVEIDTEEMEWLEQFESFDMRTVTLSVQSHYFS